MFIKVDRKENELALEKPATNRKGVNDSDGFSAINAFDFHNIFKTQRMELSRSYFKTSAYIEFKLGSSAEKS